MIVVWVFLAVPSVCQRFVIVVFPDHTHLLVLTYNFNLYSYGSLFNFTTVGQAKHVVETTCVSPSPAGPAGCRPLNFLN